MNLKILRNQKGISQQKLADYLGVSRSTVAMWEVSSNEPDTEMLTRIADYFNVSIDYLLGRAEASEPVELDAIPGLYPIQKKKFPVLGNVACGEPVFAEENRDAFIMASADIDADFCLIADGDSMSGAHIEDGDIVFVKQMEIVPNGYIAVVLIDDEATLKYIDYRPDQSTLLLHPANPAYRTQVYTGEELNQIRILGMAVTLHKDLTRRKS